MDDLSNRGIEVTIEEMKKEMNQLKRKMRKLTKTEKKGQRALGQKDRESDRRRHDISGSDQEGRRVSQQKVRAGSRLPKVDNLTGAKLLPGGLRNTNERGEMVIKSESVSAPPKSKVVSARDSSVKRSKVNVKGKHYGEIIVKKEKFTDSEDEDKKRDKKKK